MNKIERSSIFKNAEKIWRDNLIELNYEDDRSIIASVIDPVSKKEHFVNIKLDSIHKIITVTCSCTIQSLKGKHLPLCSHIIATTHYLLHKKQEEKKDENN